MTVAKTFVARALTLLGAFVFYGWAILKFVLDWVGRSTVIDDYNQLVDRLPLIVAWLVRTTPWRVPSLLALVLTVFLIWLSWPRRPQPFPMRESALPSAKPTTPANPLSATDTDDLRWLQELADDDDREMGNRVWQPPRQQARVVLDDPDPFVAFELSFMNGSVYTLHDPTLSGRIKYKHDGLWHNLKLDVRLKQENHTIPHGAVRIVAVDQLISRDMARDFKSIFSNRETPIFPLESFGLVFSYKNRNGLVKTVYIGGGNLPPETVKS